jgi:hypothetical protein
MEVPAKAKIGTGSADLRSKPRMRYNGIRSGEGDF